jgi:hypothetical protein
MCGPRCDRAICDPSCVRGRCTGPNNCQCYPGWGGKICDAHETCNEGAVHLVGGDDESRGRVLFCYNGAWYSVCADGWDTTGDEARVVCETLGYNTSNYALANYGRGISPVLPVTIQCASTKDALIDCSMEELDIRQCRNLAGVNCRLPPCVTEGLTNCSQCGVDPCYFEYISSFDCNCYTDCFSTGESSATFAIERDCSEEACDHGAVQLVGGLTDSTGRLEFCAHGIWGRVCNYLDYWGPENARVVCHQLKFSEEGEVWIV